MKTLLKRVEERKTDPENVIDKVDGTELMEALIPGDRGRYTALPVERNSVEPIVNALTTGSTESRPTIAM